MYGVEGSRHASEINTAVQIDRAVAHLYYVCPVDGKISPVHSICNNNAHTYCIHTHDWEKHAERKTGKKTACMQLCAIVLVQACVHVCVGA